MPLARRTLLASPALLFAQSPSPQPPSPTLTEIPNSAADFRGWPTLCRRRSGELLIAYSGGRQAHVCPFGRVELIRSLDNGQTWSAPQVLFDTPIDDRDAGLVETPTGALLVTTFTSIVYQTKLSTAPSSWQDAERATTQAQKQSLLGCWMLRSTDGGLTWSAPYRVPVNSPHGPITTASGRLLYPGKDLYGSGGIAIYESPDDGLHWRLLAPLPTRPGDNPAEYHELHGVEASPGHLIVHIRNHNPANDRETLQTESHDGGKAWTTPHPIGVWGLPSHLLRLRSGRQRDGRLLMSYGYRRDPRGNHVRTSDNGGATWSAPIILSNDGAGDLGYPSTVELPSGELLTLWYEASPTRPRAQLRLARYRLE
ncbi:MAG: sialidase family protein [Bryobacter sp.]|nr:sialidase family protein [Bryobacter sp.]